MREKIKCDCTGEPPGEFTTTAMVGRRERLKARSKGPATDASASPGRNGVAMPIGPEKRSTGTTGPRLKNSMGSSGAPVAERTLAWAGTMGHPLAKLKTGGGSWACHLSGSTSIQDQGRATAQDCLNLEPEPLVGIVQHQSCEQLHGSAAPLHASNEHPARRLALVRMDREDDKRAKAARKRRQDVSQRLGAVDQRSRAARLSHGRHEPHPAIQAALRHGVAGCLECIGGGGTSAFRVERRVCQNMVEAVGQCCKLAEVAQGPRDISLDDADARDETVAVDIGACQSR